MFGDSGFWWSLPPPPQLLYSILMVIVVVVNHYHYHYFFFGCDNKINSIKVIKVPDQNINQTIRNEKKTCVFPIVMISTWQNDSWVNHFGCCWKFGSRRNHVVFYLPNTLSFLVSIKSHSLSFWFTFFLGCFWFGFEQWLRGCFSCNQSILKIHSFDWSKKLWQIFTNLLYVHLHSTKKERKKRIYSSISAI